MAIEIQLPPVFRHLAGVMGSVAVNGSTVGECLEVLAERYPVLREHIFSTPGSMRPGLAVYVNGETGGQEQLARPLVEGDTLFVAQLVLGG